MDLEHILVKNIGINSLLGSTILAIISYIIFLRNIESITKINSIVVPILIFFILIVGIENIAQIDFNQIGMNIQPKNSMFFIIQAILYSSYNLILIIPVITNLEKYIKNNKQIKRIAINTAVIITIISISTFLLLVNVDKNFNDLEMPVVYVIKNKFSRYSFIYEIVILISIFTTAISVGMSFLNNVIKDKRKLKIYSLLLCIISILVSKVKFSVIINIMFPLFGYLGILQIYFLAKTK